MTSTDQKIEFSPENMQLVKRLMGEYPEGKHKSALLRILHIAQRQFGGWLSSDVMDYVAEVMNLKPIEVYEVATFYSMYFTKPTGKYVFDVCHTGPCAIEGAEKLCNHIEKRLGVKEGETTADGMFSWRGVECLGACGYAPMLQLGDSFREFLTPEKVDQLIEELKNKV